MSSRAIDEPLSDPTDDLLEMNQHAKALASYIQQIEKLPFTVGIFGEWGEGKTTMVQFLSRHLAANIDGAPGKPVKFVPFSAWAYTTSEKLWRALILEIAAVLYAEEKAEKKRKDEEAEQKRASGNGSSDWTSAVMKFLTDDFRGSKPEPVELSKYDELVKKLDNTGYGKISKR